MLERDFGHAGMQGGPHGGLAADGQGDRGAHAPHRPVLRGGGRSLSARVRHLRANRPRAVRLHDISGVAQQHVSPARRDRSAPPAAHRHSGDHAGGNARPCLCARVPAVCRQREYHHGHPTGIQRAHRHRELYVGRHVLRQYRPGPERHPRLDRARTVLDSAHAQAAHGRHHSHGRPGHDDQHGLYDRPARPGRHGGERPHATTSSRPASIRCARCCCSSSSQPTRRR